MMAGMRVLVAVLVEMVRKGIVRAVCTKYHQKG